MLDSFLERLSRVDFRKRSGWKLMYMLHDQSGESRDVGVPGKWRKCTRRHLVVAVRAISGRKVRGILDVLVRSFISYGSPDCLGGEFE